jgi:hypothetical protein
MYVHIADGLKLTNLTLSTRIPSGMTFWLMSVRETVSFRFFRACRVRTLTEPRLDPRCGSEYEYLYSVLVLSTLYVASGSLPQLLTTVCTLGCSFPSCLRLPATWRIGYKAAYHTTRFFLCSCSMDISCRFRRTCARLSINCTFGNSAPSQSTR